MLMQNAGAAPQRIVLAFVQAPDVVAIEALIANLNIGGELAHVGKLFHCKADRLGGSGKTAIVEWPLGAAHALCREQFSRGTVIELHEVAFDCCRNADAAPRSGG